ncbi:hypothetical protein L6R53_27345 [Myxococcota bacterium]|nr:hypothetical protein [Myxococcota bacterium]
MIPFALVLAPCLAPAAWAQARTAEDHLAQAELFARRGWLEDADQELAAGLALPAGQESFGLHWLAAQVAWERLDAERAGQMAARAAELAPDEARREEARALAESYAAGFGVVEVTAPHAGMRSRLQIEAVEPIFDPEVKRYVNRLALARREQTALPVRLALPVGSWWINGVQVQVSPGETTALPLPMKALGARGLAALQVTRLELGLGVGLVAGPATAAMTPAPAAQVGLTQPLGPVLLGLFGGGRLDGYVAAHGGAQGPAPTWEAGLRVGRELVLAGPLSFRPSLQYRLGPVAGLPLACQHADDRLACAQQPDASALDAAPVAIYASSLAHRPGLELSVDYRSAGRTTAFGTGVKLVVDQAFGRLPSQGQATDPAGGTLTWQLSDRAWTATGLQMFATTSFAF